MPRGATGEGHGGCCGGEGAGASSSSSSTSRSIIGKGIQHLPSEGKEGKGGDRERRGAPEGDRSCRSQERREQSWQRAGAGVTALAGQTLRWPVSSLPPLPGLDWRSPRSKRPFPRGRALSSTRRDLDLPKQAIPRALGW
uniref:Uncharacterized protein n=1 Tax=Buteo japonicus TaxID=224669 RepID=A0A8B9YZJ4_9AVES